MKTKIVKEFLKSGKEIQDTIFAIKLDKGFNTSDVPLEFCLVQGELAEAFDAWKKKKDKSEIADELADIAIYLYGLSSILKIDLAEQVVKKISVNKRREYHIVNETLVKKEKE